MLLNEYTTLLSALNLTFNPHFYRFMYFAIQNYYLPRFLSFLKVCLFASADTSHY